MSDNKLDLFLKRNAPQPPAPLLGEKQRIWRAIETDDNPAPWWRSLLAPRRLRFTLPAAALCALALVLAVQQQRRNAHADRILGAALAYQIEELEEPPMF